MKLSVLDEPQLEFSGGARHIDPRHGITDYGPADGQSGESRSIRVGIVGTSGAIDGLHQWLDRCRLPVAAKASRLNRLFVPFPGFDASSGFRSTLVWDTRLERTISQRALSRLSGLNPETAVDEAVQLYDAEIARLDEEPNCDVILVARPDDLPERPETAAEERPPWKRSREPRRPAPNFRVELKALAMRHSRPLQVIRRTTWEPSFKPATDTKRQLQDEATRAWNLHAALYYKAGGVPWRLPRETTDLTSCYIGVSFYDNGDATSLQTSVAQVFNQRGDGVIVRGGAAKIARHDRQPHLSQNDSALLLVDALDHYRAEHRTIPARVVMHKTSSYTQEEIAGFRTAADQIGLDLLELIWLPGRDSIRLMRDAYHPPLRGTMMSLNEGRHILYTKGSVPFYGTYPGMYVPVALPFRPVDTESSPEALAAELLALTKMNWNQTQLDGRDPITIRTADRVGEILRKVDPGVQPQTRYAFYM